MELSRGVVFLVNWAICGSSSCPTNCKAKERSASSTCNTETGLCSLGCKSGYYGNTCNMTCDINCEGTCQQHDGSCKCLPEYTFSAGVCESPKGVTCNSSYHCLNDRCLMAGRADCLNGCKPGWFGKFCEDSCSSNCFCEQESGNCTSCKEGWFGPECESRCNPKCLNKNCDRAGTCVGGCSTGSYGKRCDLTCSRYCVSGCDQLTGDCVQCVAGRFGSTCQSECSVGCANRDCDRDGRCFGGCSKGYYEEKCTFKCSQQCDSEVCHQMTGECTKGCLRGLYGSFCNLSCEDCKGNDCDKSTGECIGFPETWLPYIIGGGVLLIAVVLAVFIACCLIRMRRIMKEGGDTIGNSTAVKFVSGPGSQLGSLQIGNTNTSPDDTYNHLFDIKQPEATFCLADDDLETSSGYCAVLPLYRGHACQSVDGSDAGNDVDVMTDRNIGSIRGRDLEGVSDAGNDVGVMTDRNIWSIRGRDQEGVSDDRTSIISLCDVNGDDRQDMKEKAEHLGENNHKPIQIVALRSDVS